MSTLSTNLKYRLKVTSNHPGKGFYVTNSASDTRQPNERPFIEHFIHSQNAEKVWHDILVEVSRFKT